MELMSHELSKLVLEQINFRNQSKVDVQKYDVRNNFISIALQKYACILLDYKNTSKIII